MWFRATAQVLAIVEAEFEAEDMEEAQEMAGDELELGDVDAIMKIERLQIDEI